MYSYIKCEKICSILCQKWWTIYISWSTIILLANSTFFLLYLDAYILCTPVPSWPHLPCLFFSLTFLLPLPATPTSPFPFLSFLLSLTCYPCLSSSFPSFCSLPATPVQALGYMCDVMNPDEIDPAVVGHILSAIIDGMRADRPNEVCTVYCARCVTFAMRQLISYSPPMPLQHIPFLDFLSFSCGSPRFPHFLPVLTFFQFYLLPSSPLSYIRTSTLIYLDASGWCSCVEQLFVLHKWKLQSSEWERYDYANCMWEHAMHWHESEREGLWMHFTNSWFILR